MVRTKDMKQYLRLMLLLRLRSAGSGQRLNVPAHEQPSNLRKVDVWGFN